MSLSPTDLSAAARAVEEFDFLQREVMTLKDEARQLREIIAEQKNREGMLREELARYREELRTERVRTNRWLVMGVKLTAGIGTINAIAQELKNTAIEAAAAISERGLEVEIKPEDMEALKKLALSPGSVTVVPANVLNGGGTHGSAQEGT